MAPIPIFPVRATTARYIKLGRGGRLAREAIETGKLFLDYREVAHAVARTGDEARLIETCLAFRDDLRIARSDAREILDFYTLPEGALWITFHDGKLWWGFAKAGVTALDPETDGAARSRDMVDGWRSTDVHGRELLMREMDGRLTQLAAYRRTICSVKEEDRLLRILNAQPHPDVVRAREARAALNAAAEALVRQLSPYDFEILVDLIVQNAGWRRVGALGGTQKTVDLEIEQPLTRERGFVQVKSRTSQAELDEYVEAFNEYGVDRMFYAWHSGPEVTTDTPGVELMGPAEIAERAIASGLIDWLDRRTQ